MSTISFTRTTTAYSTLITSSDNMTADDDVAVVVVVLPVAEADTGVVLDARIIASVKIVAAVAR